MSLQGATHLLQALVCGLLIGAFAAAPVSWILGRRNLSWTWALMPTGLGTLAVWATVAESWSVALLVGGLFKKPEGQRLPAFACRVIAKGANPRSPAG